MVTEGGQATHRARRVGVLGTFVWDVIYGRDPRAGPVEEWGGITYALGAFDAALGPDWTVVPVIKVGADLAPQARQYMRSLRRLAPDGALVEVPGPNHRVVIRYQSSERRSEVLSDGVPPWTWAGLAPLVRDLDAIYVNFITGFELDLTTMQLLRQHFHGPIYCDLHSLLLAIQPGGLRTPRPLADAAAWCQCADLIQVNEEEMSLLASDAMALAATAMAAGVGCLSVTLGARGAVYFAPAAFDRLTDLRRSAGGTELGAAAGPIRTARVAAEPPPLIAAGVEGDPTGCGDVWGATYFSRLLAGDMLADAMRAAGVAAARNFGHRGATGLAHHLRGELSPR
jgi:hypothetical protein